MVTLTRLNGQKITINALLIETIEETPDTIITLTTGKKIIVLEKTVDVVHFVQHYLQELGTIKVAMKPSKLEEL